MKRTIARRARISLRKRDRMNRAILRRASVALATVAEDRRALVKGAEELALVKRMVDQLSERSAS